MGELPVASPEELGAILNALFPLHRSITGDGVRQTLRMLQSIADFDVVEVPTGTRVFDWSVPEEWRVREAYIARPDGGRVVDVQDHNLHLVSYSAPYSGRLDFSSLAPHLHAIPERPDAIPYRTTYYKRDWGFCLPQRTIDNMDRSAHYDVVVDTEFVRGALTLGEAVVRGTSEREYIVHTYCCHPSLGNDNLSGVVLWAHLLRRLRGCRPRHTYRFVIAPETIGALAYLMRHQHDLGRVEGAFVLATVGGRGPLCIKSSYLGTARVDRAARLALLGMGETFEEDPFDVFGSDERQYSSPGFRIPCVTVASGRYHRYPEYHTSDDDLSCVSLDALVRSLRAYWSAIEILERDVTAVSSSPYGEPMLSRRGLYPQLGGASHGGGEGLSREQLAALLWVAFSSDGSKTLSEVAEQRRLRFEEVHAAALALEREGLLQLHECPREGHRENRPEDTFR